MMKQSSECLISCIMKGKRNKTQFTKYLSRQGTKPWPHNIHNMTEQKLTMCQKSFVSSLSLFSEKATPVKINPFWHICDFGLYFHCHTVCQSVTSTFCTLECIIRNTPPPKSEASHTGGDPSCLLLFYLLHVLLFTGNICEMQITCQSSVFYWYLSTLHSVQTRMFRFILIFFCTNLLRW